MSIKVFFNESFSICKKEIDIYKKMENKLEWYDINEKESQITNLSVDQLSRRLHVMNQGKLIKGAKAFLVVWFNIPKLNWLYKILKQPILFHIFAFLYETAAIVLYLKNKFKKN